MINFKQTFPINKVLIGIVILCVTTISAASGALLSQAGTTTPAPWWKSITSPDVWIKKKKEPAPIDQPVVNQVINVEEESQTINAVEKISPSVVSIIITKDLNKYYDTGNSQFFPFDDFSFFGPGFPNITPQPQPRQPRAPNRQETGGGTGFFISPDGLILTNKHVVADEDAEYSVVTNDGKRYDTRVLARDPSNDIAIVKIEKPDRQFVPVELGDSDKLKLGQTAIAVGYSLGEYRNTVTKGVISGIGRRVTAGNLRGGSETIEEAIQTDAAINPGNSGGPLVNIAGQVIGINTAVNLQGQLIGFAIPVNQAKLAIESVKTSGKIVRPFMGVRYVIITPAVAKRNNLSVEYGALILRGEENELAVIPGSPADKAGLVENDIILEANGQKIDLEHQLAKMIGKYKPGQEVELKVLHRGDEKKIKVKLGESKE